MNHAHPQYNEDILSYTHMETPEKKKKFSRPVHH